MIKVEFIESYIKQGNDYIWNDNHGEIIRCKDCKHYWESAKMCTNTGMPLNDYCEPIDFCSKAEKEKE